VLEELSVGGNEPVRSRELFSRETPGLAGAARKLEPRRSRIPSFVICRSRMPLSIVASEVVPWRLGVYPVRVN